MDEFSTECTNRLTKHDHPSLETLKMQIAVESANDFTQVASGDT